jgi:hypothetical protein
MLEQNYLFTIEELSEFYPNQLWLTFSEDDKQEALKQAKVQSYPVARHIAYLNSLSVKLIKNWLDEFTKEVGIKEFPQIWQEKDRDSIWEFVNGTAITLGKTRLVILPRDISYIEKLRVPQEWVDIPTWAGHYYLGVQVELEQNWLRVWGYTTYEDLKEKAVFDPIDKTYSLDQDDLTEDLNVMLVTHELYEEQPETVKDDLKPLDEYKEAELFAKWRSSLYSPRTLIPFELWSALLQNDDSRKYLLKERQLNKIANEGFKKKDEIEDEIKKILHESFRGFRQVFRSQQTISEIIELIYTASSEDSRRNAIGVLGEIGQGNKEAIAVLSKLIDNTSDKETRWEAAFSLGKIDPENPKASIREARLLDLGISLQKNPLLLTIAQLPTLNKKMEIWLRVCTANEEERLPPNLKLTVFSDSNQPLGKIIESRKDENGQGIDDYLQKRFTESLGTLLRVDVTLNQVTFTHEIKV